VWISAIVAALAAAPVAQDSDAAEEALKKGDLAEAKTQFGLAVKRNHADYNAVLSYALTLFPRDVLRMADSLSRAPNTPGWVKARGLRFSGDYHFFKEDYKKAAEVYMQASKFDTASTYRHLYALSLAMNGQTEAARVIWSEIALDKANELSGEAERHLALLPPPPPSPPPQAAPVITPPVASVNQQNKVDEVKTSPTPPTPVNMPPVAHVNQQSKVDEVKTSPTPVNAPPAAHVNQQNKVDEVKTPPTPVNTLPAASVNQQSKVDEVKTPPPSTAPVSTPTPVASVNQQNKVDEAKTPSTPVVTSTPVASVNQQSKVDVGKTPPTPVNTPPAAHVNQQIKVDEVKTPSTPVAPVSTPTSVAPVNLQSKIDEVKTPMTSVVSIITPKPAAPVNQKNKVDEAKAPPTPAAPEVPVDPKSTGPVFTIQVGAFASKENADNLVKRLTGKYDDITVQSSTSGDQTFYRVRVGSFQNKEDAVAYVDKLVTEAGMSTPPRVIEK
jgi:cell division septation protein DedD